MLKKQIDLFYTNTMFRNVNKEKKSKKKKRKFLV
jgi:hypothetical protein